VAGISSNKLADLEAQVKNLITHLQELKGRNAHLEERLREVDGRLTSQNATLRQWEKERGWLRAKLGNVLGDLEAIEFSEPSLRD
jgi:predicted nuclease with TOPRIM domain